MIHNLINCLNEFHSDPQKNHFKEYIIEEGRLIFFNMDSDNAVGIHTIMLKDEYQNKGILKSFIQYLSCHYNEIWFFQCNDIMNCVLLTMKIDGKFFTNRGTGEHYWIRNDQNSKNKYNQLRAEQINIIMLPLKEKLKISYEEFEKYLLEYYYSNDDYRQYL